MQNDRRAILALVAAGRISAMEAERLLRVWNDAREELWILAVCLLLCVAHIHYQPPWEGLIHFIGGLAREAFTTGYAALSLLTKGMGGTV
jgi:hypothetical protein